MDCLVVRLKKFLAGDFLLVKSIKKILVFARESIKRKVSLDLCLKLLLQGRQLIDGCIDFTDNRALKVLEWNYLDLDCVENTFN